MKKTISNLVLAVALLPFAAWGQWGQERFDPESFMNEARKSCGIDALTPVSKNMDFLSLLNSCIDQREVPSNYKLGVIGKFASPEDYLEQDYIICTKCLPEGFSSPRQSAEEERKQIEANITMIGDRLRARVNGMGLQAALLTDEPEYGQVFVMKNIEQIQGNQQAVQEVLNHVKVNNRLREKLEESLTPTFEQRILEEDESKSCVSYKAYLSYRMLNPKKPFMNAFARMEKFEPEHWDYKELKKRYNRAVRLSKTSSEAYREKEELEAQLEFLYRNPMIKNLFSAHHSAALPKDEVREKQEELFKLLKQNLGTTSYREKLKEFFNGRKRDSDALVFTRTRANEELMSEYNRIIQKPELLKSKALPQDVTALAKIYSKINKGAPKINDTCWLEGKKDPQACLNLMANYCPLVKAAKDAQTPKISYADALEDQLQETLSYKPDEDMEYQLSKYLFCEGKHKNAAGQEMTYPEFKSASCPTEGDQACLAKFLDSYPEPVPWSNRVDGDRLKEISAKFSAHLKIHKEWNVSSEDAEEVAKGYIPLDDLREVSRNSYNKPYSELMTMLNNKSYSASSSSADRELDGQNIITRNISGVMDSLKSGVEQPSTMAQEQMLVAPGGYTSANVTLPPKTTVSDVQRMSAENDKEIAKTEKELEQTRKEAAKAIDPKEKSALEARIESLEALLAKKEETAGEFKKLLDQFEARQASLMSQKHQDEKTGRSAQSNSTSQGRSSTGISAVSSDAIESGPARSVASVPENSFNTASAMSGGANLAGSGGARSSAAGARLNDVMKAKYGITISDNSDAPVVVAQEQQAENLTSGLFQNATTAKVSVSEEDYKLLRKNDIETLKEIYEEQLKQNDVQIMKITVTPDGMVTKDHNDLQLEFYAIREGDKVVFQPVRKTRYDDLLNVLPQVQ